MHDRHVVVRELRKMAAVLRAGLTMPETVNNAVLSTLDEAADMLESSEPKSANDLAKLTERVLLPWRHKYHDGYHERRGLANSVGTRAKVHEAPYGYMASVWRDASTGGIQSSHGHLAGALAWCDAQLAAAGWLLMTEDNDE
jgi:hypothetical protein